MKIFFSIFLLSFLLFACSDKDKLPKGVLPVKQMREVMWDMIRAGEYLNIYVLNKDSSVDKVAVSQKWYEKVYQLHRISKTEFDKSYAYYQAHPVLMKEILDSLSKKQVSYRPSAVTSPHSADSLIKNKNIFPVRDSFRKAAIDTVRRKKILKKKNFKAV